MTQRFVLGVLFAALLAGCGRQLPEGGLPTAVREPTEPPTAVAVVPTQDEAATVETAEADTAIEETAEAATTEDAADADAAVATEDTADTGAETAETTTVSGDPAAGQELFNQYIDEAGFSCANCHLVDSEERLVGPGMLGLGELAETRVDGQDAVEYLHNSIIHPNDYVVETYPENLMPGVYADVLTEEQLDNLVAYLLTL
jgi:mono/diheme cytochrome c family protein